MDKRGIAGVALCVLLLIAWYPLMHQLGWLPSPGSRPTPKPPAVAPAPVPTPEAAGESQPLPPSPTPVSSSTASPVPAKPVTAAPPRVSGPPRTAELACGDFASLALDQTHGGITAVRLLRYTEADRRTPVVLGTRDQPLCVVRRVASGTGPDLLPGQALEQTPTRLVLERPSDDGSFVLTEAWEVTPETPYAVTFRVHLRNPSTEVVTVSGLRLSCGAIQLEGAQGKTSAMVGGTDLAADLLHMGATRPVAFDPKKVAKLDERGRRDVAAASLAWLALHSKYFLFYLAGADGPLAGCELQLSSPADGEPERLAASLALPEVSLPPGGEWTHSYTCYAGPKELARLRQTGPGLDAIMRLELFFFWHPDWMGWISRLILRSMLGLHEFFGHRWGFGWAIVVITFLVKMLFWPLTHTSTVSMRRMQKVQPLVQEAREKYKSDPQKLNRKVMEIYREHRVSPLGGCLPILLQIPVFFALFNTLRGAIELRHASFLWVTDLSSPDTLPWALLGLPIRPLAVLMIVTMFIQQKVTPSSMDPTQAKMMLFMTLFFGFIFYGMPSGLTLYWTVNQLLSILQTWVTHRIDRARQEPMPQSASARPGQG